MMIKLKTEKAFTLAEMMAVIAIIGILMVVAIPSFLGARRASDAKACVANLEILKSAVNEWTLDNPDEAVANHYITTNEINNYVSDGFTGLECPGAGSYIQGTVPVGGQTPANADDDNDDYVVRIEADGDIPDPTCSKGPNTTTPPGTNELPDHVLD
ncbi:MAG: prepilin-type N-terminal cleavage/methylation domain-containing protein [Actinobacteria bacterium]|nr:MAG: prepilin-type N-terminal cleavage/methylation domain-containing protein [Actinomycetota bacterium]